MSESFRADVNSGSVNKAAISGKMGYKLGVGGRGTSIEVVFKHMALAFSFLQA